MRVVVSMPTYRTPRKLLARAVRSMVEQTHDPLTLIVVEDGGPPVELPVHDRVVKLRLPTNRGRYFADAVVTEALKGMTGVVWSPHDADDWSEPERFERLLPHLEDGVAMARYWRHQQGREFVQEPAVGRLARPEPGWAHLGHWVSGVYTPERIERAGGIHPGFRVGFDTLFTRMIAMTGPVGISPHPDYHWCRRNGGSLTTARETGMGSPFRAEAKKRLMALDQEAWAVRIDPGQVIKRDIPAALADEVAELAEHLRARLG